jgi:hypothetical protein
MYVRDDVESNFGDDSIETAAHRTIGQRSGKAFLMNPVHHASIEIGGQHPDQSFAHDCLWTRTDLGSSS